MLMMKNEKDYLIPFSGLKLGKHQFDFQVNKAFFEAYNYEDFNDISAQVLVLLNKKSTLLELDLTFTGLVNVPCDVTNQDFDMPIEGSQRLIVKFGDHFNDETEELLIIPFNEHQISVAQYIYEMIALSIPQKRVHPGVSDGSLDSEALEYLGYVEAEEEEDEQNENEIDPRWDKLKQLLTDK